MNQGIVKQSQNGNLIPVDDQQERDSIQIASGSKRKPGANPAEPLVQNNLKFDMSIMKDDEDQLLEDSMLFS